MNYELKNNIKYSPIYQILYNRGIEIEEIEHFLKTTDDDINSPLLFGEPLLKKAYDLLMDTSSKNGIIGVIVDCDADGFCSSALTINYIKRMNSNIKIRTYIHESKLHGMSDFNVEQMNDEVDLLIIPDAGSNDFEYHKLVENIIILDHHESDVNPLEYDDAIIINNQLSEYPNKSLCGTGVAWQFFKYVDNRNNTNFADIFLDLVAVANVADMMNLSEFETQHLTRKGLRSKINNPFLIELMKKNDYQIKGELNPMKVAFYIAPYINAVNRSGTKAEKKLLLLSMVEQTAYTEVDSTKRGHKGEKELLVEQAVRMCSNVKTRQGKAVDSAMKKLEGNISDDDKILLFLLERGTIDNGIAGLIANKIMNKYQKSTCVLTYNEEEKAYRGSARGCEIVGVDNFKQDCGNSNLTEFSEGHASSFGIGIKEENIDDFIKYANDIYKDIDGDPVYYIDLIIDKYNELKNMIFNISKIDDYFVNGTTVLLKNLHVTKEMIDYSIRGTLKISINDNVEIIKFGASREEYDKLYTDNGCIVIDLIGECGINKYNGQTFPQIKMKDFEIKSKSEYYF